MQFIVLLAFITNLHMLVCFIIHFMDRQLKRKNGKKEKAIFVGCGTMQEKKWFFSSKNI